MKKKISFILILIVLVAAAGFGGYLIAKKSTPQPQNQAPAGKVISYTDTSDWKVWQDTDFSKTTNIYDSYSLKYPRDFDIQTYDQAQGGNTLGTARAKISFPRDAFKSENTNFAEAYLTASVAKTPAEVSLCYKSQNGEPQGQTTSLNGINYYNFRFTDAGAGNYYDSDVYRTLQDNICYEFSFTIHTGNIYNYPQELGIKEFDKTQASVVFNRILQTVNFSSSTTQPF